MKHTQPLTTTHVTFTHLIGAAIIGAFLGLYLLAAVAR